MRTRIISRREGRHSGRRTSGGFTLIELLVACALMAVLALLSWRGLDSILQTRERLIVASDELRSLTLAFSQMDEDLLKSWPVKELYLDESYLRVNVAGERNAQSLQLIREVNRSGDPTRIQRVVYEVRGLQLARGFGEYGQAEPGRSDGGAVGGGAVQSMVWQPILGGVRSITIRGWVDGRGWLDASALGLEQAKVRADSMARQLGGRVPGNASGNVNPIAGASGVGPSADAVTTPGAQGLPSVTQIQPTLSGIEVVLERVDGQRFLRVFSVKD